MIMNHEIYMGAVILETIKNELAGDGFTWYKENKTQLADRTFRETDYFLTANYLIQAKVTGEKLLLQKYDRNTIERVEKEFDIKPNNVILKKVIIFFKNDDSLFLKRPSEQDNGQPKKFEEFAKQL